MSERTRKYWTRPTGWSALDHWRVWIQDVIESGAQLPNGADARALRSFLRAVAKEYSERKWTEYPGFCESCGRKIKNDERYQVWADGIVTHEECPV